MIYNDTYQSVNKIVLNTHLITAIILVRAQLILDYIFSFTIKQNYSSFPKCGYMMECFFFVFGNFISICLILLSEQLLNIYKYVPIYFGYLENGSKDSIEYCILIDS